MSAAAVPVIRIAFVEEAAPLADLAEQTFRETFSAENAANDMEAYCASHFGIEIQARELCDTNSKIVVAAIDRTLIGYGQVCWSKFPECVTGVAPGELRRLYVRAEWHGTGVARSLFERCLAELARHGSDVAWLGVWERNARAMKFYEKLGFQIAGEQIFQLGSDFQRDLILCKALDR